MNHRTAIADAEVRAELEDFLGEPAEDYESVAAMVDEADHRLAEAVSGPFDGPSEASLRFDSVNESDAVELGHGVSH